MLKPPENLFWYQFTKPNFLLSHWTFLVFPKDWTRWPWSSNDEAVSGIQKITAKSYCLLSWPEINRGEKSTIGQFLRGSLPWLTNDRDTKPEEMTSVCFAIGLPWSEKCKQNHAWFWTELGYKFKTEKCKPLGDWKIWNSEQWQYTTSENMFNESFSPVASKRCYIAFCQFFFFCFFFFWGGGN